VGLLYIWGLVFCTGGCCHQYSCLVAYRQAGSYPNSGRGIALAYRDTFETDHRACRPSADLVQVLSHLQDNGFPSGHAIFAIMILGLPAYFMYINMKNQKLRMVVLAGLITLILLIGTSRVYLGVHWPSDVIGGYLIGGALLTVLIWFHQTRKVHN
jgi:membrane-associated phospholipid phosphatase